MTKTLTRRHWMFPLGLAMTVLTALVLLLASESKQPARADDGGEAVEFAALKPVTAEALANTSELVRARLDFRLFSLERAYERENRGQPLQVSEFGQVQLPEGEVFQASIGDSVCAFFERGVGICGERDEIALNGVVAVAPGSCESNSVLGIVPGGITEMTFDNDGDGHFETTAPVISNVYAATLASRETLSKGIDRAGNVVFEDVLPLDGYASGTDLCEQG